MRRFRPFVLVMGLRSPWGGFDRLLPLFGLWSWCRPGSTGMLPTHQGPLFSMEPHCALGTLIEGRLRLLDLPWGSVQFGEAAAVRPVVGLWSLCRPGRTGTRPRAGALCSLQCGLAEVVSAPAILLPRDYDVFWLRPWVLAARCPGPSTCAVPPPRQPPARTSSCSTSPRSGASLAGSNPALLS